MAAGDEIPGPGINADRAHAMAFSVPDAMRRELKRSEPIQSARVLPGISLKPRRLDAGDRAGLVAVRRVAGNADRADDVASSVSDQHAARIGHHAYVARRRQHGEELRRLGRSRSQRARAEAHAERAPGLAERD